MTSCAIGLDAAHLDAELGEQLHELAAAEAEVDHRVAADELLGELRVARPQVVAAAAEERGEVVLAVPRRRPRSRECARASPATWYSRRFTSRTCSASRTWRSSSCCSTFVSNSLPIVDAISPSSAIAWVDEPVLLLDLRQHAVDLAAQRPRHERCTKPAAGKAAGGIDARPREADLVELAQRGLELVVQGGRRPRPHADEPIEVLVERRLEIVGILARAPALLDPSLQLGDDGVEVDGAARGGRVSRIRRHGVNLAEGVRPRRLRALACRIGPMANDRLPRRPPTRSRRARVRTRPVRSPTTTCAPRSRPRRARRPSAPDFPTEYVERVHEQAARFALRTAAPDDIRAAIALLEEQTNVQALAPVDSRNRGVDAAKKVVRKAVFFAMNHLTEQMRALGWATTSVGDAAAERIEQLEARVRELEARLARTRPGAPGDPSES